MYTASLTRRIIVLITASLLIASYFIFYRSENILETALLDQTKQQAQIFLLGIESELQNQNQAPDPKTFQELINKTLKRDLSALGFSIYQIYFFDQQGNILAHSHPGKHTQKIMKPHYLAIFNEGTSYLENTVKQVINPDNGQTITKADIIIPFHYKNKIIAALEVEIDVESTFNIINQLENSYKKDIFLIILLCGSLTLLLIWTGIKHWLFTPITNMAAMTKKISRGNLQARLEITSNDELGQLCHSINQIAESIENLFNEQETAHLQILHSLVRALEAKDSYTAGHSGRVTKFSTRLGRYIGLDDKQLTLLKQGALMHDLGKIGITDAILNKQGALNDEEYKIMRQHPLNTAKILKPLKRFKEFTEIASWHHERWDGKGYPDGLKGEETPLLARIVSIADSWDAMTSDRVYRMGMSTSEAISIMEKGKDSGQWDPSLIRSFIEMIRKTPDL